jgi:hypothetical protein
MPDFTTMAAKYTLEAEDKISSVVKKIRDNLKDLGVMKDIFRDNSRLVFGKDVPQAVGASDKSVNTFLTSFGKFPQTVDKAGLEDLIDDTEVINSRFEALHNTVKRMSVLQSVVVIGGGIAKAFDDSFKAISTVVDKSYEMNKVLNLPHGDLDQFFRDLNTAPTGEMFLTNVLDRTKAVEGLIKAGVKGKDALKDLAPLVANAEKGMGWEGTAKFVAKANKQLGMSRDQIAGVFAAATTAGTKLQVSAADIMESIGAQVDKLGSVMVGLTGKQKEEVLKSLAVTRSAFGEQANLANEAMSAIVGAGSGEIDKIQHIAFLTGRGVGNIMSSIREGKMDEVTTDMAMGLKRVVEQSGGNMLVLKQFEKVTGMSSEAMIAMAENADKLAYDMRIARGEVTMSQDPWGVLNNKLSNTLKTGEKLGNMFLNILGKPLLWIGQTATELNFSGIFAGYNMAKEVGTGIGSLRKGLMDAGGAAKYVSKNWSSMKTWINETPYLGKMVEFGLGKPFRAVKGAISATTGAMVDAYKWTRALNMESLKLGARKIWEGMIWVKDTIVMMANWTAKKLLILTEKILGVEYTRAIGIRIASQWQWIKETAVTTYNTMAKLANQAATWLCNTAAVKLIVSLAVGAAGWIWSTASTVADTVAKGANTLAQWACIAAGLVWKGIQASGIILSWAWTAAQIAWGIATGAAALATWGLGAALAVSTGGLILIIPAVIALGYGVYKLVKHWDSVKVAIGSAVGYMMDKVGAAYNWVVDKAKWAGRMLNYLNPFSWFSSGKAGSPEGGSASRPASVKREPLAEGGIVTSPTNALIGEAGPEAVIPLSGGKGGSSSVINVHQEEVVAAINKLIHVIVMSSRGGNKNPYVENMASWGGSAGEFAY